MRKIKKLKMVTAAVLAIVMMLPVAIAAQPDPAVTRESVAEALTAAIEHYYEEYNLDFAEILASINVDTQRFADLLYIQFGAYAVLEGAWDSEALREHADAIVRVFLIQYEVGALEAMMQNLVISTTAIELLGHSAGTAFFALPIFHALDALFGFDRLVEVFYRSPAFAEVLSEYGAGLLQALDFDLFAAIDTYLTQVLTTDGLQLLNRMMDMNVVTYILEASGLDIEMLLFLEEIDVLFSTLTWDDVIEIVLGGDNLEERMAFETAAVLGIDIYLNHYELMDYYVEGYGYGLRPVRLNLFFRNQSDDYAIFHVAAHGAWGDAEYAFLVPPNGERTVQLPAEVIFGGIVELTAVSREGEHIAGELALRLTEHPLP